MPNLNFVGKSKVVNYHRDVSFRFLERQYGSSENMIIHGDNLLALRALLATHRGKIKCIYIDPPYNTGNENWIYNDNVNDPEIRSWIGKVVGDEETDLNRHDKWLCMMYPRLRLLHELLSDDGVIFISIDYNENYNLRSICNEIFGELNFIGEIYWESKTKSQNTITAYNKLQPKMEMIFVYSKNQKRKFNLINAGRKIYDLQDAHGIYREHQLEFMNAKGVRGRESMVFDITVGEKTVSPPEGRQWQIGVESVEKYKQAGDLIERDGKIFIKMRPEYERVEKTEPFWGFFSKEIGTAESAKKELSAIISNHNFETVKPVKLIKRLIFHSTDKNSIILDAFAGSGTTAQSVIELNREDQGSRKFILIESMDYCESITAERVRRIGGDFSFYELGDPIFIEDQLNPDISRDLFRRYLFYSETKKEIPPMNPDESTLLGIHDGIAYHLFNGNLDLKSLAQIKTRSESYVIFAESCTISEKTRDQFKIIFRKIPRDIRRI